MHVHQGYLRKTNVNTIGAPAFAFEVLDSVNRWHHLHFASPFLKKVRTEGLRKNAGPTSGWGAPSDDLGTVDNRKREQLDDDWKVCSWSRDGKEECRYNGKIKKSGRRKLTECASPSRIDANQVSFNVKSGTTTAIRGHAGPLNSVVGLAQYIIDIIEPIGFYTHDIK